MAIPDFQSTMQPLLVAVNDGEVHVFNDVFERLLETLDLTEQDKHQRITSGKQTVIKNRVSWARSYLTKAGLLVSPGRGLTQITDRGRDALAQTEHPVRVKYLKQFPEFVAFHSAKPKAEADQKNMGLSDGEETATPQERLSQAYDELAQALADDLLETIKTCSPSFFEQLVVDLMLAMGYGGWSEESGSATQYSADGGIDGIINEDPLGLETIYLQAKRYKDATVGRPEVQAFAGALDMKRAKKGVFITASQFSREAKEFVGMIEKKIKLIDGQQLAELMIKHNLGVSVREAYQVKALDTDYFSED